MSLYEIFRLDSGFDVFMRGLVYSPAARGFFLFGIGLALLSFGGWGFRKLEGADPRSTIQRLLLICGSIGIVCGASMGVVLGVHHYELLRRSTLTLCELTWIRMNTATELLDKYRSIHGTFPVTENGLRELSGNEYLGEAGPKISEEVAKNGMVDGGSKPLKLLTNGFSATLRAAGPDGIYESVDDFFCEYSNAWACTPDWLSVKEKSCLW